MAPGGLCPHGGQLLGVDALGCLPERDVAQRGQAVRQEVLSNGALGLLGDIDLPIPQPLEELVG